MILILPRREKERIIMERVVVAISWKNYYTTVTAANLVTG